MKRNLQKISITIDPELLADADRVAARIGISRSALIADCLADNLQIMRRLLEGVPLDPVSPDVRRLRGESADTVRERLDQLKGMADDLFAKK
jgi:antitoxin component of RelBE/YafQ-DinJ toxin-antitoxin module